MAKRAKNARRRAASRQTHGVRGGEQAQSLTTIHIQAASTPDHAEERDLLKGVYDQMFRFMRRRAELERQRAELERQRAELERQRAELERQCVALEQELRDARTREDDTKVDRVRGRRAERRYNELLAELANIADDYRASVDEWTNGNAPAGEAPAADTAPYRLQRLMQGPLERIEAMLASQGVSVQRAEVGDPVDVRRFDVAAVIDDPEHVPGTVVRTHRPAYVDQDGNIVRKGAAVASRRGDSVPTDQA